MRPTGVRPGARMHSRGDVPTTTRSKRVSCSRGNARRHRGRQSPRPGGPRAGALRPAEHRGRRLVRRPSVAARGDRGRSARRGADGHPHAAVVERRGHPRRGASCGRPTRRWASSCSASTPSRVYALALLESGSDGRGYLLKERVHDRAQLLSALETVADGGSVMDTKIVDVLVAAKTRAERSLVWPSSRPASAKSWRRSPRARATARSPTRSCSRSERSRSTSTPSSPSWTSPRRRTRASGSRPRSRSSPRRETAAAEPRAHRRAPSRRPGARTTRKFGARVIVARASIAEWTELAAEADRLHHPTSEVGCHTRTRGSSSSRASRRSDLLEAKLRVAGRAAGERVEDAAGQPPASFRRSLRS